TPILSFRLERNPDRPQAGHLFPLLNGVVTPAMPNWIKGSFTEVRLRFERKTQVFNQMSAGSPRFLGGFAPAIAGLAFLIGLSMLALPTAPPHASGTSSFSEKDPGQEEAMPPLQGAKARSYLQQRGDYDSLMHALTA